MVEEAPVAKRIKLTASGDAGPQQRSASTRPQGGKAAKQSSSKTQAFPRCLHDCQSDLNR